MRLTTEVLPSLLHSPGIVAPPPVCASEESRPSHSSASFTRMPVRSVDVFDVFPDVNGSVMSSSTLLMLVMFMAKVKLFGSLASSKSTVPLSQTIKSHEVDPQSPTVDG